MKRVATAVVLIPLVLLLVLRAPVPLLAVVVAAIAVLAAREFFQIVGGYGVQPFARPTYIFFVVLFVFLAANALNEKPLLATGAFIYVAGLASAHAP